MPVTLVITTLEEAQGLSRWGARFARSTEDKQLRILFALDPGAANSDKEAFAPVEEITSEFLHLVDCTMVRLTAPNRYKAVLADVASVKPELLILAEEAESKSDSHRSSVDRRLFDRTSCATMLLRLGDPTPSDHLHILVPTTGGPHSRAALNTASMIAADGAGEITPLLVEPDVGEVATDVGLSLLEKTLKRSGLKVKEDGNVHPRVVVADKVVTGLREVTADSSFDLLIIGATGSGTIRRKLFGTIPDRFLKGSEGMTVAVMRRAKPVGARIREKVERFLHLRIPQLRRNDRIALFENLQTNSRWSFDFMALMFLSTGIAAIGLILGSTAVVIGAMLVAPLMTPLLGAGLALVQGNLPMMRSCIRSILYGFVGALAVSFVAGLVCPLLYPITELTHELASRGRPQLLDMGVAFLSGIAAAYCISRPGLSSALAGVAIAAALVPPIATTGISLAFAETGNSMGAALLFATNVVAIILGAAFNFYAAGIRSTNDSGRSRVWVQRTVMGLVLSCAILAIPLSSILISRLTQHRSAPVLPEEVRAEVASHVGASLSDARLSAARLKTGPDAGAPWILELGIESARIPPDSLARELADLVSEKLFGAPGKVRARLLTQLVVESD